MTISSIAYTLIIYVLMGVLVILTFIPILIYLLLPKQYRYSTFANRIINFLYVIVQKLSLLPITYRGVENLIDEPVVFVANHQSAFDIPLLGKLARKQPHLWLARDDVLGRFWLVAPIIRRAAVTVDVSTPRKAMASLFKISKMAQSLHAHVMIFPEGGRYTQGAVRDFFGGFVILAKKLQRPVVPVFITGVNKAFPPTSWLCQRVPVTVTVGEPLYQQEDEDDATFKKRVHQWYLDQGA